MESVRTNKEIYAIAKALKYKYRIQITKTIQHSNFVAFYESVNKNDECDIVTRDNLLTKIKLLNENTGMLLSNGKSIIEEELRFKKLNWPNIISNIKTALGNTNQELGLMIGCDRRDVSSWEIGRRKPNYTNSKRISDFVCKNSLSIKQLSGSLNGKKHTYKDRYERVVPLTITKEAAELIGIINGDGTIAKSGQIRITGNPREDYLHHKGTVCHLIHMTFRKQSNTRIKNGVTVSEISSLYAAKQLSLIGVPIGKKYNLRIPQEIVNNGELLKSYLRGLFDTDGTICRRNKNNIRIGFGSFKEINFAAQVNNALIKLSFNSSLNIQRRSAKGTACISNDLEAIKFFTVIGSSNQSKIARFLYWRLNGYCPSENFYTFRLKLKDEYGIDVEKLPTPFIWKFKYVKLLDSTLKQRLLGKLDEDESMLEFSGLSKRVNWCVLIRSLKDKFSVKTLKKCLNCNHKTLWQWQKGTRMPNLILGARLLDFCHKNNISMLR